MAILTGPWSGAGTQEPPFGFVLAGGANHQILVQFADAVAMGEVSGWTALQKFGENPNIDSLTVPETVWAGGGIYPYLTSAEQLQVDSADVDDVGTTRSSGTATGGSTTTLVDTTADFVSDSVVAGDVLVNDTNGLHGVVLGVAVTTLTVNTAMAESNDALDAYRVVGADDTGASLIKLEGLDASYAALIEYVVLNGQTNVVTTASFLRVFRSKVIAAGGSGASEGQILVKNNADAVTLLQIDILVQQTQMALWTVPAGKNFCMHHVYAWESNGKRCVVQIFRRPLGEVFRQVGPTFSVNASHEDQHLEPMIVFPEKTDIELRANADVVLAYVGGGFDGVFG